MTASERMVGRLLSRRPRLTKGCCCGGGDEGGGGGKEEEEYKTLHRLQKISHFLGSDNVEGVDNVE
jgi:hypothetical protein